MRKLLLPIFGPSLRSHAGASTAGVGEAADRDHGERRHQLQGWARDSSWQCRHSCRRQPISTPTPPGTTPRRAKSWSEGHVRIYRATGLFVGDRAIYNVDTKEIQAVEMRTDKDPYLVGGENVTTISEGAFLVSKGTFTTHDSSNPDFRLQAKTVRIYENDRVVFQNVTFYVKNVPIFWWPYMYQSLNDAFSYMVSPAYLSSWGPSLLCRVSMPITDDIKTQIRLDYRSRRGVAFGFEPDIRYGEGQDKAGPGSALIFCGTRIRISIALRRSRVGVPEGPLPGFRPETGRILPRTSTASRTSPNSATSSSSRIFIQSEFQLNPKPDNVVAVTKTNPIYTLTAIGRFQANNFFETTERLPESRARRQDGLPHFRRTRFFMRAKRASPISVETSPRDSRLPGLRHAAARFLPSIHSIPTPISAGSPWCRGSASAARITTRRAISVRRIFAPDRNPFIPDFLRVRPDAARAKRRQHVSNGGERRGGIVLQDFARHGKRRKAARWASTACAISFSRSRIFPGSPAPTQIPPPSCSSIAISLPRNCGRSTFPQFTTDRFDRQLDDRRVGVRNRLQTRRDDLTVSWMDVETYIDVNFDNPFDKTQYSNLFNKINFTPVPWARLRDLLADSACSRRGSPR